MTPNEFVEACLSTSKSDLLLTEKMRSNNSLLNDEKEVSRNETNPVILKNDGMIK